VARLVFNQFRDFVLDLQLFALELQDFQLVADFMVLFLLNFFLERLVPALQFNDMTLQGHANPPFPLLRLDE
jgi:hypothetical protein